jgi:hypothetical protein
MKITRKQIEFLIHNITEKSSSEENKLCVWIPMKLNDLMERLRKKTKGKMTPETLEFFVRDDLLDEITRMRDYQSSVEKKIRFFEELHRKLIENKPFNDEEKHFLKTELLIFQHTEFPQIIKEIIKEIKLFEETTIQFLNERFNIMFVDSKDIEKDEEGLYRRIYEKEHTLIIHESFTQKGERFQYRKYPTRYYEVDDKMLLEEEDEEEPRITRATHESVQQRGAELEKHRKKHYMKKVMISRATKKFITMLNRYNTATKSPNKNLDDNYAEFEAIQLELATITDNFEEYRSKIIRKCEKYSSDMVKNTQENL